MGQSELDDILMVLLIGVYADKKIVSSEIKVFIRSVSRLNLSDRDLPKISEAKALAWFEMNKNHVREMFNSPRSKFERWFLPILKRVEKHGNKTTLFQILDMIFKADNEVHISEKALAVLIKRVWGINKTSPYAQAAST